MDPWVILIADRTGHRTASYVVSTCNLNSLGICMNVSE